MTNIEINAKTKNKLETIGKILFPYLDINYDDFDEIHKNSPDSDKMYQKKMVEFGVTPTQVFKSDLEKRMLIKK